MAVTANNLANVSTTGFKKGRAVFEDLLYQNVRQVGAAGIAGHAAAVGPVARHGRTRRRDREDFTQGSLSVTGNSLDVAINGRGFFQVLLPDGTSATRATAASRSAPRASWSPPPATRCSRRSRSPGRCSSRSIGTDGVVSVQVAGQAAPTQVGTLQLTDFINPAGLQPRGENLLLETAASGAPQTGTPGLNGLGTVQQGSLEASNVNVVEELVSMIETQRAYEMNSKAISTTDQMLEYLTTRL
jgi:flagellar basal-body rod protein FlgG